MHSAGGQRDDPVPAHSFTLGGILTNSSNLVYLSFEIKQKVVYSYYCQTQI